MHPPILKKYPAIVEGKQKAGYLDKESLSKKLDKAREIFECCHFCERRCAVNRANGEKGYCRVTNARVASEFIHPGEEEVLVPSYTVFFSGCTFACQYCQNWDISQYPRAGRYIEPGALAGMISKRVRQSVKNVNWVGGDPTPNIPYILETLMKCSENIAQVWNSNMYLSGESLDILRGVIDLYLTDFKYGNSRCAKRLSDVDNYFEIITRNHKIISGEDIIIRHLVLPNHLECCTYPALEWIAENLAGKSVMVNIMAQYRPEWRAKNFEDINRKIDPKEFYKAVKFADDLGINLC